MVVLPVATTPTLDTSSLRNRQLPFILASHSSPDCYFDIKLTQVESTTFHGKRAQQLEFKLDFARPFDQAKRIRSAEVSICVEKRSKSKSSPKIVGINPEASLVKIADHEITNGQSVGVTAGTPPTVPASAGVSANLSFGQKTSFAGNRLIHGFLKSHSEAQWKMYEEPRSESGLPPSLSILMIVRTSKDFLVSADLCATRWSGWGSVGKVRCMYAPPRDESLKPFLVTCGGRTSERVLKAKDNIDTFLKENEQRLRIKETIVDELFPDLTEDIPTVKYLPVLALRLNSPAALLSQQSHQQINIPFAPYFVPIGRRTKSKTRHLPGRAGFLDAPTLSLEHAKMWADKSGRVWIQDLGSSSGTFITGRRLSPPNEPSAPHELREHDTIKFGARRPGHYDRDLPAARVQFVGYPDFSSMFLDSTLQRPATRRDEVRLSNEQARAIALVQQIEDKFERWRSGTTEEDQLAIFEHLQHIANDKLRERCRSLCMEMPDSSDEYSEPEPEPYTFVRRRPSRTMAEERDYEDFRSKIRRDYDEQAYHRRSSNHRPGGADNVLFGKVARRGEDALVKHQTVGKGWLEVRLNS